MSNSIPTSTPTPSTIPTTTSPSSLSLSSVDWVFLFSEATTCTNVSINWQIFNAPSDLSAIFASTSTVDFAIKIIGFSSNVSVPLKSQGSAEQVLGPMRIMWFANVPAGFYDLLGVATADDEQGISTSDNTAPVIGTTFTVNQGADTSCIIVPFGIGSSSSSSSDPSQTRVPAQPHSHSSSNTGGIAGGVGGGTLALALLAAALFFFLKRRKQHNHRRRRGSLSSDRDHDVGWNLTSVGSINSPSTVLARDDALVSSNRDVSTIIPNSSDSGQGRNSLLTRNRGTVCATETSTEALFNSYAITPLQIPSLPVADFEEEKITHDNPRPLPLAAPNDSHLLNDAANSSPNQRIRPLPNPFDPASQPAISGSTHAVADLLETSTAPFSRLSFTGLPEERHADSGVRLARDTLLYDETNSEWSLRSKDRLPPPYSHN